MASQASQARIAPQASPRDRGRRDRARPGGGRHRSGRHEPAPAGPAGQTRGGGAPDHAAAVVLGSADPAGVLVLVLAETVAEGVADLGVGVHVDAAALDDAADRGDLGVAETEAEEVTEAVAVPVGQTVTVTVALAVAVVFVAPAAAAFIAAAVAVAVTVVLDAHDLLGAGVS